MSPTVVSGADRVRSAHRDAMPDAWSHQIRDALAHLHDSAHLHRHPLALLVQWRGGGSANDATTLRRHLLDAINAVRPPPNTAADSHRWRSYQLMTLRYVEALDPPTVQARLAISKSEYYRDHRRAVEAVGSLLQVRWSTAEVAARPALSMLPPEPDAPPGRLPSSLTSFIGRNREVAVVTGMLAQSRLVTLTGPPGVGKTRLALEAAVRLQGDFADGAIFVPLAPITEPAQVASRIAQELGVREAGGQSLDQQLQSFLRQKRLLLVLDNFEHVLDAAPVVTGLLAGCPHLQALVTSRAPLRVSGERQFPVPPLSLPDPRHLPPLDALAGCEAVQLFVQRAQDVLPSFSLTIENASAVADICRRLDGLPLAIHLAAAWIRVLSVEQIASRLDDRYPMLTGESRTAPARQRSVRATLDWSYALLTEPEQAMLRGLAVFSGGWTLDAAEAVTRDFIRPSLDPSGPPSSVLELLSRLVDTSLVLVERHGAEVRYRFLETIRQYGHEKLEAADELALVRRRHRDWFLSMAAQMPDLRGSAKAVAWFDRVEREHDNVRAALRWSLEHGDAAEAVSFGAALWPFWAVRGHWTEGRRYLGEIVALPGAAIAARGHALEGAGRLAYNQADFPAAHHWYQQSLDVRRALRDTVAVIPSLHGLANVAREQGDYANARAALRESLALAREAGDVAQVGSALNYLGLIAIEEGDFAQARMILTESLRTLREHDHPFLMFLAVTRLGHVAHVEGQWDEARRLYGESLAYQRTLGDQRGIANVLSNIGLVAIDQGDPATARAALHESLSLVRPLDDRVALAQVLSGFVGLAALLGLPQRALRLAGAAATLRATTGLSHPRTLRDWQQRWVDVARSGVDPAVAAAAWADGEAMSLEEAIAEALGEGEESDADVDG